MTFNDMPSRSLAFYRQGDHAHNHYHYNKIMVHYFEVVHYPMRNRHDGVNNL